MVFRPIGTGNSLCEVKAAAALIWQFTSSAVEVKNAWYFTSSPRMREFGTGK
jgi:hypothetical protein